MTSAKPNVYSRSDWGARAPKWRTVVTKSSVKYSVVHWPGSNVNFPDNSKRSVAARLRGYQNMHMNDRGWSDIAYNVAVDQNGNVWLLRGWNIVDGGVKNMGGKCLSILAILGKTDTPSEAMKAAIVYCQNEFDRLMGKKLTRTYHGKLVSTSCPGPKLTAWAKGGFKMASTPETKTPNERGLFRIGTWNTLAASLGGSATGHAEYMKKIGASLWCVQETNEARRNLIRKILGDNWLTFPVASSHSVAVLFNKKYWKHNGSTAHGLGTPYHGGVNAHLTHIATGKRLDVISYHGPVKGTTAEKKQGMANTLAKLKRASIPTVLAGDFNMNDPLISGFKAATPLGLDTMNNPDKPRSYDQIYASGPSIRGYELHRTKLSDHALIVGKLTL